MNTKVQKKSVSVIERVILAVIALLAASVLFALSAHSQPATAASVVPTAAPTNIMGPANTDAKFVGDTVTLPRVAWADCFNVYRDGKLIAPCVKGSEYLDSSPEITPGSRFTYELSAVNATGESPRFGQGGPYPSNH